MLKCLFLIVMFYMNITLFFAQEKQLLRYGPGFGTMQYQGDHGNEFWTFTNLHAAAGFLFTGEINKSFDWEAGIHRGLIDYSKTVKGVYYSFNTMITAFNFSLRYKLNDGLVLEETFPVTPYVTFGFGDGLYSGNHLANSPDIIFSFPLGAGVSWNIWKNISLEYAFTTHYTLSEEIDNINHKYMEFNQNDKFMVHRLGLLFYHD